MTQQEKIEHVKQLEKWQSVHLAMIARIHEYNPGMKYDQNS